MSPVVRKQREGFTLPGKYLLLILTLVCIALMLVTFGTDVFNSPVNTVVGYLVVPFEDGISRFGGLLSTRANELTEIRTLLDENESLRDEIAKLTEENTVLQQDKYELNKLRELVELDEQYGEYKKTGARIIASDTGNWYSVFTIDKGTNDGIMPDMNVIAGGGLVGKVSSVGPNWSKVTSIISDNSNVSAMMITTEDNLIVSGNLELMKRGNISFSQLIDSAGNVGIGDKIVTSNISDKFLPNILIGYVTKIETDANNLTKSVELTPAVDFEHLSEVLVITDLKQNVVDE